MSWGFLNYLDSQKSRIVLGEMNKIPQQIGDLLELWKSGHMYKNYAYPKYFIKGFNWLLWHSS